MRTRKALVDAYLAVLLETRRVPTTAEVAQRARCSMRTIFERFGTLANLGMAAFDAILEARAPTSAEAFLGADRASRIRFQVSVRANTCETFLPLWRLIVRHEGAAPQVDERLEKVRALTRARLELMYAPELGSVPDRVRESLLIALEALTDFSVWGRLRESNGLSVDDACEVWRQAIDNMLPPTPAN
ncbi:MAG: hypothetical protein U1E23_01455 [Reyranellaceae bacterium]